MSKSGRKIGQYSAHPLENEVLFLPSTQFKVKSVTQLEDGSLHYSLEEI